MDLELDVKPLEYVSKIHAPQKCLIPKTNSTSAYNYGNWVRCVLRLDGNDERLSYVICQIYYKASNAAYLDGSVTIGIDDEIYGQKLQGTILLRLESLREVADVDMVDLDFVIDMDFFSRVKKTADFEILEIAKLHLQAYCLTNDCTVRSKELERLGIVAIHVNSRTLENEDFCCFSIDEDTCVRMGNVRILNRQPRLKIFHTNGFETPLKEFEELLERLKSVGNSNALLVGPVGCGKSSTIAYFVEKNHCNYFHISMEAMMGQYPGETECKMREIFEAARKFVSYFKPKTPTIIHLKDLHLVCPASSKSGGKECGNQLRLSTQLCSLLDSFNRSDLGIICLASTKDVKLLHKSLLCAGRYHHVINIDPPNDATRKRLFHLLYRNSLSEQSLSDQMLDNIASQTSGYVIADLALLVRCIEQALLHKKTIEMSALITEILAKSKPASIRAADVSVIRLYDGFDTIGGMQTLKDTLRLNVLTGLTHAEAYKRFGLNLPKGILLYGPPGCAKTTIAKCLAAEAKMTFICTSGAEVYSPYVGCAEKFIAKLFDTARKHAPCLLFLDEIDTLVGGRSLGSNAVDVQMRILATLLTEMDGIVQTRTNSEAYILVVAATNRPQIIDDALLRPGRFDQLIHVPAPDRASRLSILELHKRRMPFAVDCNLEEIATRIQNYSGADICSLCNEAALHALSRDLNVSEISNSDFEEVLQKHRPSLTQRQIDTYLSFQKSQLR